MNNAPIGIFDSGLGGLTVVSAVRKSLPGENIVYLGDTARVPYGNRSPQTIRHFAAQDIRFLLKRGVKAVVAACNTVSATALDTLKNDCPVPVIGVIEPGAQAVIQAGTENIVVLATRATIASNAYPDALKRLNPRLNITALPCPLFVPMAEEGVLDGNLLNCTFDLYLRHLKNNPPDAILLGCTHYPLLKSALSSYFSGQVQVIDSAATAADALKCMLKDKALFADPAQNGSLQLAVTDIAGTFREQALRFLGHPFSEPEKVVLE